MSRFILLIITLILMYIVVFPASAQNPFMSKKRQNQVSSTPALTNKFLHKIAIWQQQLKQKMSSLARQMQKTGDRQPFFLLIMLAFLYGLIHAAGPGHGKTVAMSYIISRGKNYGSALFFGNLIAFFHGFFGVCMVLILHFILNKRISGTIEHVNQITQIASYSLITIIGAALLSASIYSWLKVRKQNNKMTPEQKKQKPFAMIFAISIIPCPGIMLVMLFFLSIDLVKLGVTLAFFQTLGMAITISLVVIIGLTGKRATLSIFKNRQKALENVERTIETTAALFIMAFGLLFLAAAF